MWTLLGLPSSSEPHMGSETVALVSEVWHLVGADVASCSEINSRTGWGLGEKRRMRALAAPSYSKHGHPLVLNFISRRLFPRPLSTLSIPCAG